MDERAQRLYEEGAKLLAARWDDEVGLTRYAGAGVHDSRGALAYADVLLREDAKAHASTVDRIIANVAEMQETREQDAHYGNFRWFYEDACVTDLNAVEFALDGLVALLSSHGESLSAQSRDLVRRMIALGLEEIDRLDVHPSYTNIALSDICNSVLGGQLAGDEAHVERGRRRLDEWFEFTAQSGAPHEYNSPTYLAIDITRMAHLAEGARDADTRLKARIAEELLWVHVATHYHPALAQIAGPHSRSYRDGWTGAGGYLKLLLWRLLGDDALRRPTPYFPAGREEGHTGVALAPLHCPGYVLDLLREKRFPYACRESVDAARGTEIATHMARGYALGTASRSYGVGEPPEPWPAFNSLLLHFARPQPPGYGTLFCRYIIDDRDAPGAAGGSDDFWDEGRHVAAQHGPRAIVAYGLHPRMRPLRSAKLSVRVLGLPETAEVWCGDRRLGGETNDVAPGDAIVMAAGDAFVALIPLEPSDMGSDAPLRLTRRGEEFVLDIHNYVGPPKSFWEHRSQGGPFFKGNVRNAFVLEVADADDFKDLAAFRAHIAAARIADSVDESLVREIAYGSEGGAVTLRYSLRDMTVADRRSGGVPALPAIGAGAVDGTGPQWRFGRETLMQPGSVVLTAGPAAKWLFADEDGGRYVFVSASDDDAPAWMETPKTVVECDEFGFGRIDLDEREGTLSVDAVQLAAPVRFRSDSKLRLVVGGVDVSDELRHAGGGMLEYDRAP